MSSPRRKTQLVGKDLSLTQPDSPVDVSIERLRLWASLGTLSFKEPALGIDEN